VGELRLGVTMRGWFWKGVMVGLEKGDCGWLLMFVVLFGVGKVLFAFAFLFGLFSSTRPLRESLYRSLVWVANAMAGQA
jgi:hypothetical protein